MSNTTPVDIESSRKSGAKRATRNMFYRIGLIWLTYVVFFVVANVKSDPDASVWSDGLTLSSSALLAIISFFVSRNEIEKGNRAAFLNWSLLFGVNALLPPIYTEVKDVLLRADGYATVYFIEYSCAIYLFLLSMSVAFAVIHSIWRKWSISRKYHVTLLIVGTTWLYLFHPYLSDPRFLYGTADIKDYRVVNKALEQFHDLGIVHPTSRDIALSIRLFSETGNGQRFELSEIEKERRVAELFPYMEADNHRPLVLKPLNENIVAMSSMCVCVIFIFIIFHYLKDPPKTAYLEKVILVMLPYCTFEAVHAYVFSTMHSREMFIRSFIVGQFFSVATMMMLVFVLLLRLRFVLSAEGRFYERHLATDPAHITRWRDSFDNWILHQFMNAKELEERFAIQGKRTGERNNADGKGI